MAKKFTAFLGVFEQRLEIIKRDLKKELEKSKHERQRERLKKLVKEARELRDLVRELKPKCPHCGKTL